jgi:amino acid transporter
MQFEDDVVKMSPMSPEATKLLIQFLPLWILLFLVIYALVCILYGLAILGDFPDAAVELENEIKEAKAAMKKRGVPVVE